MRRPTNINIAKVLLVLVVVTCVVIIALRPQATDFITNYYNQYPFTDPSNISSKSVIIFAATGFFEAEFEKYNYISQCSKDVQSYCSISSRRQYFEKASAVVFHARDYKISRNQNIEYYFKHRNTSVPYVIWTFESPMNEQEFPKPPHIINWTMSYKLSSDVPFPYGVIKRKNSSSFDFQKIWDMKKTSKTGADIAWMVSNCETPNKRMGIMKKLQELGLKIDIFGTCGVVPAGCSRWAQKGDCESKLISPYKFYIAMENSNCKDYVTEKFWKNTKKRMTVPIVLGKKVYVEAGIPESSFIAIDDFKNLTDFSELIKSAIQNKTKYMELHEWRNNYEVIDIMETGHSDYGFCKLCQKLRAGEHFKTKKWYNELMGKWHTTQECDNEVGYRFLN